MKKRETGKKEIVDVGCGIIVKKGRLLIAQRKYGAHMAGYWEFPGGKCRPGEDIRECLIREAYEELRIHIKPKRSLWTVKNEEKKRVLLLNFYLCEWILGDPVCEDCLDFRWVAPRELRSFMFLPADRDVITELIEKEYYYLGMGT